MTRIDTEVKKEADAGLRLQDPYRSRSAHSFLSWKQSWYIEDFLVLKLRSIESAAICERS